MDALQAEEVLRDRGSKLSAKSLRKLVLLATGSEDAADQAYCDRVLSDAKAGIDER